MIYLRGMEQIRQPEQTFEAIAQGPLWNRAIYLPAHYDAAGLVPRINDFALETGSPVLGYLKHGNDGAYFYMTRYPDSRPGRPHPPDDETCNGIAEQLADWLGGDAREIAQPEAPLMAAVGRLKGYDKSAYLHDRGFAHSLFTADVADAHMIAARFRQGEGGKLELARHDEPLLLVTGGLEIADQVKQAAYNLGQWHIPIENHTTKTITMCQTGLAQPR